MADDLRRVRVPAPIVRRRLPSGRGATEQPNQTGEGDAPLTPRLWLAIVLTGVAAGLLCDLMMWVLFSFQDLAFGAGQNNFQSQVEKATDLHRIVALLVAGAFAGPAWYLLRRWTADEHSEVEEVVWADGPQLSARRVLLSGAISEIVIGMGASIGREAAPKALGGLSGDLASKWLGLTAGQRRLLVACGAGAGLSAAYNVPLGGALFAAELMLGSITLPVALPAMVCSFVATGVSWIYLPDHPAYTDIPNFRFTFSLLVFAAVAGPVIGALASGYIRLVGWVSHHRLAGWPVLFGPVVAFGTLGLVGIAYPDLLGNGKDMAHSAFLGQGTAALLLALFAIKPLVTALCLGGGAQGGLFTPFMSTGAVFGAGTGILWLHVWPGSPVGAFALIGAAAMLGSSIQAPLAGLVLVVELTQSGLDLIVPIMVATFLATEVARRVDGYSIYSARLPAKARDS